MRDFIFQLIFLGYNSKGQHRNNIKSEILLFTDFLMFYIQMSHIMTTFDIVILNNFI